MNQVSKSAFFIFLAIAIIIAFFSPLASPDPDGLDWTIEKNAGPAAAEAEKSGGAFLFPDYKIPFIKNETASTIFSAFTGLFIILAFFRIFLGKSIRHGQKAICKKNDIINGQNAL